MPESKGIKYYVELVGATTLSFMVANLWNSLLHSSIEGKFKGKLMLRLIFTLIITISVITLLWYIFKDEEKSVYDKPDLKNNKVKKIVNRD